MLKGKGEFSAWSAAIPAEFDEFDLRFSSIYHKFSLPERNEEIHKQHLWFLFISFTSLLFRSEVAVTDFLQIHITTISQDQDVIGGSLFTMVDPESAVDELQEDVVAREINMCTLIFKDKNLNHDLCVTFCKKITSCRNIQWMESHKLQNRIGLAIIAVCCPIVRILPLFKQTLQIFLFEIIMCSVEGTFGEKSPKLAATQISVVPVLICLALSFTPIGKYPLFWHIGPTIAVFLLGLSTLVRDFVI